VRGSATVFTPVVTLALQLPIFLMLLAAVEQSQIAAHPVSSDQQERRLRQHNVVPYLALVLGYGLLTVAASRAGFFPWSGLVAGAMVMTMGVAARQLISMRENHMLVVTDSLTGLSNRLRLRDAMSRAAERSSRIGVPMAVLLIDLDRLKEINDTLGHNTGDAMLAAFADVLRTSVRPTDTPARLGGDEFAVVLDGVSGAQDVVVIAERILADAMQLRTIGGHPLQIRSSIGIAVEEFTDTASGRVAVSTDELLHRADVAMYSAKRSGTHSWKLYAEDAMDPGRETPGLVEDLRRAVTAGELRLHYQPIVTLATGELVPSRHCSAGSTPPAGCSPPPRSFRSPSSTGSSTRSAPGCSNTRATRYAPGSNGCPRPGPCNSASTSPRSNWPATHWPPTSWTPCTGPVWTPDTSSWRSPRTRCSTTGPESRT
jgi:diguanylate cyclase